MRVTKRAKAVTRSTPKRAAPRASSPIQAALKQLRQELVALDDRRDDVEAAIDALTSLNGNGHR